MQDASSERYRKVTVRQPISWKSARIPFRPPIRHSWKWAAAMVCAALVFVAGYATRGWISPHTDPKASHIEPPAAPEIKLPPSAKISFTGALTCEGILAPASHAGWVISCLGERLELRDTPQPEVEIPGRLMAANPSRLAIEVPGWKRVEIPWPSLDDSGHAIISEAITLVRQRADLSVELPPGGTDYDSIELLWLHPLDNQPAASMLEPVRVVPLDFSGRKSLTGLATGIYQVTLKSRTPDRIAPFILQHTLTITDERTLPVLSIPSSLSRTYIGFGHSTSYTPTEEGRYAVVFGVNLNVRKNSGELLVDFKSLRRDQTFEYADLRPRPDCFWPIGNLSVTDPGRITFDCPLFYADHRMTLNAADGRITLNTELIMPSDDRELWDMLSRMRDLLNGQARKAARDPSWFDPRFINQPLDRLPSNDDLLSRDRYSRHLARVATARKQTIELGARLGLRMDAEDSWDIQLTRVYPWGQ